MRKNRAGKEKNGFKMFILDDDRNILEALEANFRTKGYEVVTQNNPIDALEQLKMEHFDILILDFIMAPICGDEVVARLREFDTKIFVILLTGHKELAPPLNTIRELEIQGYCEKGSRFDQLELLVESCVKTIRHMQTIYRYQEGLSSILESTSRLHQLLSMEQCQNEILKEIQVLSASEDGFVWVKPEHILKDVNAKELPAGIYRGSGYYDKPFSVFEKEDGSDIVNCIKGNVKEQMICYQGDILLVPLKGKEKSILGVLGVKVKQVPDSTRESLLSVYAEQVSTALRNTLLKSLLDANNKHLSDMNKRLMKSYKQTVEALRLLVDAKDLYTRGHSDRVSCYAVELAKHVSNDEKFINRVRIAGLLHDVGKIGVSDAVLSKPERLNDAEFAEIKRHPEIGADILSCMDMFSNMGDIVLAHHECFDGTGYPRGLKGENIPLEARMITIADAFDAMMSDRHYRKKLSFEEAVKQLEEGKNTQFDGGLVEHFLKVLEHYDDICRKIQWTYGEKKEENKQWSKKIFSNT